VTYDGRPALKGKNLKIILHALVLSRGEVFREDLAALIGEKQTTRASGKFGGVRNALSKLRNEYGLAIPEEEDPVLLPNPQPEASIDLWEFFAHSDCERFTEAYAMIAEGQEPRLLAGADDPENPVWKQTLDDFRRARKKVIAAVEAASGSRRSMLATRERLLSRSLVPGVGPSVPIRSVRDKLEELKVPWTQDRPEATHSKSLPSSYLAEILTREGPNPTQALVVGGPGAGKTLTAISTFLRLTDPLEADPAAAPRTVLYVDLEAEGSQPGFGTAKWLARRLRQEQAEDRGRPILIMPHGDALLSPRPNLKSLLDSRLFRDHDLLLCCGSQLYSRRLRYEEFGTHVVHLDPWDLDLQKAFALRIAGERKCAEFEAWREREPTRRELCDVPLHLVHVLSLLGEDAETLAEVSTPAQLFEGVARMRLRVAGTGLDEDELIRDLGALAHRFYADAAPADTPIAFSAEELQLFLKGRGRKGLKRRSEMMINNTLLTVSRPDAGALRFEDPSWGWYFVARHIVHTVLHRPGDTLMAFSKLLSARMATHCEEMLWEKVEVYEDEIHTSLGSALRQSQAKGVDPARLTIARGQVGYLFGVLGGERARGELEALVDPASTAAEPDILVRRGVVLGLADGGAEDVADRYVEILARERERGGSQPERDANVGFMLSSRGDQRLDLGRPQRIAKGAKPLRAVGDIVQGFEDPRHTGSRRIKLFTLLDLGHHSLVSGKGFEQAVEQHREQLQGMLEGLKADPDACEWPEVEELEGLLAGDRRGSARVT
jgi:hypothetical protein